MRLVLIDGSNLYESARASGIRIDYKRLLDLLDDDEQLLRAYYFTALRDKSIESPVRKTVDWLRHNGYVCITKQTQEFQTPVTRFDPEQGKNVIEYKTKIKGNVDVDIASYAFINAALVSEIWLFSGDGDFTVMVKMLQERYALKVYVVSSMGLVSTELRAQADKFINLSDIREDIQKEVV
jgi:uncharacterized LabA/DUF88 family protein